MGTVLSNNLSELHLHLGSSTTPHFLWELAHEQGIKLPEKDYWRFIELIRINHKTTSADYLKTLEDSAEGTSFNRFALSHKIQSSPFAVEKCIHYAISRSYREHGLKRVEIRFNPMFRNREGDYDLDKIMLAATVGLQKAVLEYPIKAGLIIETDRQFTAEQHNILAQKAVAYKNLGVVGIDVSGPSPEKGFNVEDWSEAVSIARKGGLGITIHTGEFTSVDEVRKVVSVIKPDRIGHGIAAAKEEDVDLLKNMSEQGIVLELCPTSNIQTSVVKDVKEFGKILETLREHHVKFTINTDGTEFFQNTITSEFELLQKAGCMTDEQVEEALKTSAEASFIH